MSKAIAQKRKLHSIAPYKRHIRKISFLGLCLSDIEHCGRHIQTDHAPGQWCKRTSAGADSGGNLQHRIRRLRFDPRCGIVYLC